MSTSRPWWASEGPVDGGVDPAQDPLEAHRSARRGFVSTDEPDAADAPDPGSVSGPTQPGSASGPTQPGSASGPTQPGSASGPTQPGSEICGVCPVCIAARMLADTRPELLAHLTEAARHVSAALRTLLESPVARGGRDREPDQGDRGVRRIDLD